MHRNFATITDLLTFSPSNLPTSHPSQHLQPFYLKKYMIIKINAKQARRLLVLSFVGVLAAAVVPYGSKTNTVMVVSIGLDKILHFAGFGVMTLLAIGAGRGLVRWKKFWLLALVPFFGLGIEGLQYFLPYRTFNPVDIFANLWGVLCGVIVWGLLFSRRGAEALRIDD